MKEILKVLNKEIKVLKDDIRTFSSIREAWWKRESELEKQVENLKQEKEVLMNEITNLKESK